MNKRQIAKGELKRTLLLMKYDNRKTLSENTKSVKLKEQTVGQVALGTGAAIGTAALLMKLGAFAAIGTLGAPVIIGGAVVAGVVPLVYWLVGKDKGSESVNVMLQMCKTQKEKIEKLEKKMTESDYRDLSDTLFNAMQGMGTDEEAVYGVFNTIGQGTAADLCEVINRFEKENGSLFEWLDDDFDDEMEWRKIYTPIRNCVEDSLKSVASENPCKTGEVYSLEKKKCVPLEQTPEGPAPVFIDDEDNDSEGGYRDCDFPLVKGCKGEKVVKIQQCLGLSDDGKFGPKTEKAVEDAGYGTDVSEDDYEEIVNNCKD